MIPLPPVAYRWLGAGALVVAVVLVIGGQHVRIGALKNKVAALAAQLDDAQTEAKRLDHEFRAREARTIQLQKEAIDAAEQQAAHARADAAVADAAAGRLQQRVAALVAQARRAAASPAPAGSSPATPDAVDLLADLQRRLDEAAGQLARIADERGRAGELCEKAYDSLTQ